MKYFAFIDGEQRGPFDLEQLIEAGVRPSTYVWCKGMDDWHRADEVPEICRLLRQHLAEKMHPTKSPEPIVVTPDLSKPGPKDAPASNEQNEEEKPLRFPIRESQVPTQEPDYNSPPQVSMTLAVATLLLCFPPAGIAAVVFAHKAQKTWQKAQEAADAQEKDRLCRQSHEYARLAKMWLGLTVALGIIFWTLLFSVNNKF